MGKIIEWVNRPRVQHPLRLTLNSRGAVRALAFSPDGARLAQAVNDNVVLRDSTTGFTLSTLSCGSDVLTIVLKDNMILAGCENGKIKLFKLNESQDWCEIQSEPPLSCSGIVWDVSFSQDGQHIAAAYQDGGVYIFSLNQQSRDWEIRSESPLRGHRYVPSLS